MEEQGLLPHPLSFTNSLFLSLSEELAWVDFGLFHMFRDTQACQDQLKSLRLAYTRKILAPGPWLKTYCGSFLLGEKSLFPEAEAQQEAVVQAHLPRLTWEVNYWTQMSCFQWYRTDHDDSILKVPEGWLSVACFGE